MSTYVLGISAYYHDSAAALVRDGVPVAAAQEERFTRVRHDSSFPARAIQYCLDSARLDLSDLAAVVYHEDSKEKFTRVLSSFASAGPGAGPAFAQVLPNWLSWKRNVLRRVDEELRSLERGTAPPSVSSQHHRSHAASAFYPSPYRRAAVLCVDGVGEWQTTTIWHGQENALDLVDSILYPHSLGLLYSAFTYYCGFKVDSGEYKLMGLAPYGQPRYADLIREHLINIRPDHSFTLYQAYFEYVLGTRMVGGAFEDLLGAPPRLPESPLTQRECDLAASVQAVTEEVVLGLATRAAERTGEENLCLAGGVALNCVANGVLSRSGLFSSIWVQPAAGDAGCALGAAMDLFVDSTGRPHLDSGTDAMSWALLGPSSSNDEIEIFLKSNGYVGRRMGTDEIHEEVAKRLDDGAVVGWFQGRMEFGPRALGARSILGDPRNAEMQRTMNLKIKFRESFRPFAPVVLATDASKYFDVIDESPYMSFAVDVTPRLRTVPPDKPKGFGLGTIDDVRSAIPAVTHVNYSARLQTVPSSGHPLSLLLAAFKRRTGCSVLINTSFNVRGEPIVRTPAEAYACFMRTGMDILVLGDFLLVKDDQPEYSESIDWRSQIPLD